MPRILALQDTGGDPSGCLPLEIASQPPLARQAYRMLIAKPGRSLASIARELGSDRGTLSRYNRAGRWALHLKHRLDQSPEAIVFIANEEARRSRAATLANNRIFEGAIEASLRDLVEVDEHGQVVLRAGVEPGDVEKLARARQTHVKTTQLLTGEAAANQRTAAKAGASIIVLGAPLRPEPIPVEATVIAH